MIKNDKTKIKPRDTFIIDSVSEKNGCYWAELFKLGNKIVNKPQLVKLEDLVKIPTSMYLSSIQSEHSDIFVYTDFHIPE